MGKKPTGYARQKIIVQHKTWVPFYEWIYQRNEANYRYADAVRSNIGYALDQQKQQERHKAFVENAKKHNIATVYKGNIIKNLIMDCQSYTKYRPNETTGGIFVSWRRKEELPTGA